MKKKSILYAVSGEGMGHAIRSKVIIKHLLKRYDVHIISSQRAYKYLSKHFKNVTEIEGMYILYRDNSVMRAKTVVFNVRDLPKSLVRNTSKMFRIILKNKIDLIISDFEYTSNYVSKIFGIPLISIDNIHMLTKTRYKIPKGYRTIAVQAKSVIRSLIQAADHYLITTFFKLPVHKKDKKKVDLVSPILRKKIFDAKLRDKGHILVYQTSDSYSELIHILTQLEEPFIVYGMHKNKKIKNVTLKTFDENKFIKDLSSCSGVILNGGFTTISEALYLKKPILCVPVKKQFEQVFNATYIEKLGYGLKYDELSKESVAYFLKKLPEFKLNLAAYNSGDNSLLFEKLEKVIKKLSKKKKFLVK